MTACVTVCVCVCVCVCACVCVRARACEHGQEKEVGYPVKAVAIQTDDVQAVTKEFTSLLKLKADNGKGSVDCTAFWYKSI